MSKVSIQFDIAFNLVVPLTATHNFVPVPPVPPVPPPTPAVPLALTACAFEIPVTMHWPPGMLSLTNWRHSCNNLRAVFPSR